MIMLQRPNPRGSSPNCVYPTPSLGRSVLSVADATLIQKGKLVRGHVEVDAVRGKSGVPILAKLWKEPESIAKASAVAIAALNGGLTYENMPPLFGDRSCAGFDNIICERAGCAYRRIL
jgi:hypothetical protein